MFQRVLKRGIRGFLAGAVSSMVAIAFGGSTFADLADWLTALGLAGVVGGVSGLLLALDKAFRDIKAEATKTTKEEKK